LWPDAVRTRHITPLPLLPLLPQQRCRREPPPQHGLPRRLPLQPPQVAADEWQNARKRMLTCVQVFKTRGTRVQEQHRDTLLIQALTAVHMNVFPREITDGACAMCV
jgi:hypothetical protein